MHAKNLKADFKRSECGEIYIYFTYNLYGKSFVGVPDTLHT